MIYKYVFLFLDMTADAVAKTAEEKVKAWGIPASDFIDDVEKFLSEKFKSEGASDQEIGTDQAEAALRSLDELLQKYKMFQAGLSEKVISMNMQDVDIQ